MEIVVIDFILISLVLQYLGAKTHLLFDAARERQGRWLGVLLPTVGFLAGWLLYSKLLLAAPAAPAHATFEQALGYWLHWLGALAVAVLGTLANFLLAFLLYRKTA